MKQFIFFFRRFLESNNLCIDDYEITIKAKNLEAYLRLDHAAKEEFDPALIAIPDAARKYIPHRSCEIFGVRVKFTWVGMRKPARKKQKYFWLAPPHPDAPLQIRSIEV